MSNGFSHLFRVKGRFSFDTVIRAGTKEEAIHLAGKLARDILDPNPTVAASVVVEINDLADLPSGWQSNDMPHGDPDSEEKTIGELLTLREA